MTKYQDITLENFEETLKYNGFSNSNNKKVFEKESIHIFIAPKDIYYTVFKNDVCILSIMYKEELNNFEWFLEKCNLNLKPLPIVPTNLWDYCLQNGWTNTINGQHDMLFYKNFQLRSLNMVDNIVSISISMDYNNSNELYHYCWALNKFLSLDKQIKLLNTFIECYTDESDTNN